MIKSGSQASSETEFATARLDSRNTKPVRGLIARAAVSRAAPDVARSGNRGPVSASLSEKSAKVVAPSMFFCLSNRSRAAYFHRLKCGPRFDCSSLSFFDFCARFPALRSRQPPPPPPPPPRTSLSHALLRRSLPVAKSCACTRGRLPELSPSFPVVSPPPGDADVDTYGRRSASPWGGRDESMPDESFTQPDAIIPDERPAGASCRASHL